MEFELILQLITIISNIKWNNPSHQCLVALILGLSLLLTGDIVSYPIMYISKEEAVNLTNIEDCSPNKIHLISNSCYTLWLFLYGTALFLRLISPPTWILLVSCILSKTYIVRIWLNGTDPESFEYLIGLINEITIALAAAFCYYQLQRPSYMWYVNWCIVCFWGFVDYIWDAFKEYYWIVCLP